MLTLISIPKMDVHVIFGVMDADSSGKVDAKVCLVRESVDWHAWAMIAQALAPVDRRRQLVATYTYICLAEVGQGCLSSYAHAHTRADTRTHVPIKPKSVKVRIYGWIHTTHTVQSNPIADMAQSNPIADMAQSNPIADMCENTWTLLACRSLTSL